MSSASKQKKSQSSNRSFKIGRSRDGFIFIPHIVPHMHIFWTTSFPKHPYSYLLITFSSPKTER